MKKLLKQYALATVILSLVIGQIPIAFSASSNNIQTTKTEFLISEEMKIIVNGLTKDQIETQNVIIGVYKEGDKEDASSYNGLQSYISDFADGKTWKTVAPNELGNYEYRLSLDENSGRAILETVPFKVISLPAKEKDVVLNKTHFLSKEKATLTLKGLSKGQIDNNAWAGVFLPTDKMDGSSYNGNQTYIADLRDGKTWPFEMPSEFGDYEIRVFTQNVSAEDQEKALFSRISFTVGSNLAKSGDLKINKTAFLMSEDIMVTISGMTKGQIDDGAWTGMYLPEDEFQTEPFNGFQTYISDFRDGKTWKFKAPTTPGDYQIRVFTKNIEAENREFAYFGMLSFSILNAYESIKTNVPLDWSKYTLQVVPDDAQKLAVGNTLQVSALAAPKTTGKSLLANNKVVYKSSNAKIASIDKNGLVKALAKGSTKITVSAGTQNFVISLTIE